MPCASFLKWDFAFGEQGASPLHPDRQGAGAEYLRSGKGVSPFPPVGEAPVETGMVVQERHTAPVGTKPAFLQALGTPCACCRRRPTVGTDHARNGQMLTI